MILLELTTEGINSPWLLYKGHNGGNFLDFIFALRIVFKGDKYFLKIDNFFSVDSSSLFF